MTKIQQKKEELFYFVEDYIKTNNIFCSEQIQQSDTLLLDAPDFMAECCEIVGYTEHEEVL